jgi:SAM-dependent methyltransferase
MVLPDGSVDAVLASSSWHWMDPVPALREVARVLKPDGILGALWTGPDPEGAFMAQAQALLAEQLDAPRDDRRADIVAEVMLGDVRRPVSRLEIPPGVGFEQPEHRAFTWDIPLDADELIGLLGTLSWVITMPEDARSLLVSEARRLLGELLGIEGDVTVDVAFRSDVWRTRTTGR